MRKIVILLVLISLFGQVVYAEEEKQSLMGEVGHTAKWEGNRRNYNMHYRKLGETERLRPEDMFWSGEKFVVTVTPKGKKLPVSVDVEIIGTEFFVRLMKTTEGYRGELFDPAMIGKWGQRGQETLEFRFSAEVDGEPYEDIQRITVDDLEKYWLMHRKE